MGRVDNSADDILTNDRFETDLKNLFEILRWNGDEEALMERVKADPTYQELEEDMSLLIGKLSGRNLEQYVEEGRGINMQDIFERRYQTGVKDGKEEGRKESLASFVSILKEEGLGLDAIYAKISSKEFFKDFTKEEIQALM